MALFRSVLFAPLLLLVVVHHGASSSQSMQQGTMTPATASTPAADRFSEVLASIRRIEEENGCRIGIAYDDPSTSATIRYRAAEQFHAASTMKVPVMIEAVRRAEAGEFALTDTLLVDPRCKSVIDGSEYLCDARDYLESKFHQPETILRLIEEMIINSDNLATNLLIQKLGPERITQTMRELGAANGSVVRGLSDEKAYQAGLSNRITADDLNALMRALGEDSAASPVGCELMRSILLRQHYTKMIPALLPAGVRVANKTGNITAVDHDTAIVYTAKGVYYLTILTDGHRAGESGIPLGAEISRAIYEARGR